MFSLRRPPREVSLRTLRSELQQFRDRLDVPVGELGLHVTQIVGRGPLRGHFELAARRGLTGFVGREREIAELRRALGLALGAHGQMVAVVAEAGTSKSRLFYEFKAKFTRQQSA
jgi:hypothetical protein